MAPKGLKAVALNQNDSKQSSLYPKLCLLLLLCLDVLFAQHMQYIVQNEIE